MERYYFVEEKIVKGAVYMQRGITYLRGVGVCVLD